MLKTISKICVMAIAVAMMAMGLAQASEFKKDSIIVKDPWMRASHSGSKDTAGYAHIQNNSDKAEYLVAVKVPSLTKKSQLHEMSMVNNVMKMKHLRHPIKIAAHSGFDFKPGGFHIMLMDLKHEIKKGDVVEGTFYFRNAGAIPVKFNVADSAAVKAPN